MLSAKARFQGHALVCELSQESWHQANLEVEAFPAPHQVQLTGVALARVHSNQERIFRWKGLEYANHVQGGREHYQMPGVVNP